MIAPSRAESSPSAAELVDVTAAAVAAAAVFAAGVAVDGVESSLGRAAERRTASCCCWW